MTTCRVQNYNVIPNAINEFDQETILRVYEKIFFSREFEIELAKYVDLGKVIAPVYFALGEEAISAALSEVVKLFHIFTQHRAHALYLSLGASPDEFRDEMLGLSTGYSAGRAGSSCMRYMKNGIKIYGELGLIGENVPRAAGAALATYEPTLCMFGDGAAEEDYVLETLGFAATKNLPLLFICTDNDLSILTKTSERRSWDLVTVAKGFGVNGYDISDDPWTILHYLNLWDKNSPLLINCRTCRERWHVGTGIDGPREWERNIIVRQQIVDMGLNSQVEAIENLIRQTVKEIWTL